MNVLHNIAIYCFYNILLTQHLNVVKHIHMNFFAGTEFNNIYNRRRHNLGIQIKQKEVTNTFMMISN